MGGRQLFLALSGIRSALTHSGSLAGLSNGSGVLILLYRIMVWGVTFALWGAYLWGSNSYDATGIPALKGASYGFLFGALAGIYIHFVGRRRK